MWKSLVLSVLLIGIAPAAPAQRMEHVSPVAWQVRQPTRFIVSVVLRKADTADIIKPVHGIEVAESAELAQERFLQRVQRLYPGYVLITTLVTQVPAVGVCETTI